MSKLSVVIITFNEELQIGRCLDSVKSLADEVIVLDSFSADNTESICKSRGVTFVQHAFDGYIEQKNRALDMASHDLVLSLDADEALSDTLKESIAAVKASGTADGYTMNRLNNYCGKWIRHSGWYPDRKLRLVNKHKARWEGENPHDRLEIGNGKVRHLEGDLLHYSYHSIKDHVAQVNHFTEISSRAMFARGKKAPVWRLLVNPSLMFLKCYFLKLGFLDGFYGFIISIISSNATFIKYAKLRQLWMLGKRTR